MKKRTITSIYILLITALAIVGKFLPYQIGAYIFDIFILSICLVASNEMAIMIEKMGKTNNKLLSFIYPICYYAVYIIASKWLNYYSVFAIEVLFLILYYFVILLWEMAQKVTASTASKTALHTMYSCLYPSFALLLMLQINHMEHYFNIINVSMVLIVLIFAITMLTDTFAYLVGSTLHGPKLCPKISPKKTISGAIGGLAGGIIGAILVWLVAKFSGWSTILLDLHLEWWHFFIVGIIGSIIGQCGDLFESLLKRRAGIKDSGNLFPGHGGMLDRVDAMTFVVVFVYLFTCIIIV